jgi:hypothetical protein
MIRFSRTLLVSVTIAAAATCYAAAAADTPAPATGATEVQPAAPPAKPAVAPTGFPAVVIPGAILIGIAAAVSTQDDDAQFPTSTSGTGTR